MARKRHVSQPFTLASSHQCTYIIDCSKSHGSTICMQLSDGYPIRPNEPFINTYHTCNLNLFCVVRSTAGIVVDRRLLIRSRSFVGLIGLNCLQQKPKLSKR